MMKIIFIVSILIFISGCIDTTQPTIGTPNVDVKTPYAVNPNLLGMMIDTDISVPITNTRNDPITVEILQATLIVNNKDESKQVVTGYGNRISIAPQQTGNIIVTFRGIPAKYQLVENPLRVSPLTNSYQISVRYKASTSVLFGLLPYSKEDIYTQTIPAKEIPISDDMFKQVI